MPPNLVVVGGAWWTAGMGEWLGIIACVWVSSVQAHVAQYPRCRRISAQGTCGVDAAVCKHFYNTTALQNA